MSQELRSDELPRDNPRVPEQLDPRKRKPQDESEEDTYDKTIEDSFPASDPPSSIPDPDEEEDAA
jgi:hypothetical protein